MAEKNYFAELAKIDVGNYTEKKGQFTYLSWAFAVDQILRFDPEANWEVKHFTNKDGIELPYMHGPNGAFVEVAVTVKGITRSQIQPVMDFKNKSIANPDAMDVNKAIQRCLVKGIALHGLGLYIYAGEDLPMDIISGTQLNTLNEKVAEFAALRNGTEDAVWKHLGITSAQHLSDSQAQLTIDKVQAWINKAKEEAAAQSTESTEKAAV